MTDDNKHSFEEQWRQAFDESSLTPSDMVWDGIDSQLDKIAATPLKPSGGGLPAYYIGGVLVGGILTAITALWYFNNSERKEVETKPVITKEIILEKPVNKVPEAPVEIKEEQSILPAKTQVKSIKIEEKVTQKLPDALPQLKENTVPEDIAEERIILDTIKTLPISTTKSLQVTVTSKPEIHEIDKTPYYEKPKPKPKKKSILSKVKVSVGVGAYQQ